MHLYLHVTPGANTPFDYRCQTNAVVIGRSKAADLSIPRDQFLSKRHARVFKDTGTWYLEDLGSRNTTLLNGRPVDQKTPVADGDVIRLSDCRIEVALDAGSGDDTAVYRPAKAVLRETGSKRRLNETPYEPVLKKVTERLALLNEVHRVLANPMSRDEIFELVLDSALTHLRGEEGVIFLENDAGTFERVAVRSTRHPRGNAIYSRHLIDRVAKQGMAALVRDIQEDERFSEARSLLIQGIRSVVAAPLQGLGGRAGMVVLATRAVVRNFTHADLELLVSLASVATLSMKSLELHEEASRRQRLQKELELARQIQVALFPNELPTVPGYELCGSNQPSQTVSGDLYRIETREEGRQCVLLVADVAGKGIGASLLTASLEALAMGPIEMGRDPAEICYRVSRRLHARTPAERFATALIAVLEPDSGVVRYANAGHNPALIVRGEGAIEQLWATGVPLGMLADADYVVEQARLGPGDSMVIYTDGVTEARNPGDEEYGIRRLEAVCRNNRAQSATALARAIASDLDAFTESTAYEDDRTIVVARRTPSETPDTIAAR